jgi:hypothetical protein
MKNIALILILFLLQSFITARKEDAKSIVDKMLLSLKNYNSACYTIDSYERLVNKNEMQHGRSFTKVLVNPFKLYIKINDGSTNGIELIYCKNENNDKVRVNAGKWIPTLKLSPYNSLILKDQHHTIFSAGFSFVYKLMLNAKQTTTTNFDSVFLYQGDINWKGIDCYKLVLVDKNWKLITYKPFKNESPLLIGRKLFIPEYSMLEFNKNITSIVDEIEDKEITIPSSYAKKVILYIDKTNFFPIYQEMQDDKGIFEKYEITNLKVNPAFTDPDFQETF